MKKVLVAAHHDAYCRQMVRWASNIKRNKQWEPIIYIHTERSIRHFTSCFKEKITIVTTSLNEVSSIPTSKETKLENNISNIKKYIKLKIINLIILRYIYSIVIFIARFAAYLAYFNKEIQKIRKLIRKYDISTVMITESCPAYGGPLYIRAANQEGIPVVTIPIEKITAKSMAENYLYSQNLSLNRAINRIIGYIIPKWVIVYKNQRLLRVEPEYLLALECLRLESDIPWNHVGNQEDLVILDSQASLDHYLREGVSEDQMVVVGSAEHDIIYKTLHDVQSKKKELYSNLKLTFGKPLLLSPLVQPHYVSGRPTCDFQDYEKMMEFWVKAIGNISNYNVIISLHPSQTTQSIKWNYIEQWGVKISTQDIATLIPLCDIFVAAGSSTIPWAIACGKPVINYNVYRYEHMSNYPYGVFTMQEQDEFIDMLTRLTSDMEFYSYVCKSLKEVSHYWGIVDGHATDRLIKVFEGLIDDT